MHAARSNRPRELGTLAGWRVREGVNDAMTIRCGSLKRTQPVRPEQRVGVRRLPDARAAATVVASSMFPPFEKP